jgi:hypothetical protein
MSLPHLLLRDGKKEGYYRFRRDQWWNPTLDSNFLGIEKRCTFFFLGSISIFHSIPLLIMGGAIVKLMQINICCVT